MNGKKVIKKRPGFLINAARGIGKCTSAVDWGEVIYHALRTEGERAASLAGDAMRALPLDIVDVNEEFALEAAHLKAFNKVSYADCFAAGLAMKRNCELMTGDKEFKQVEDKVKVKWIKK